MVLKGAAAAADGRRSLHRLEADEFGVVFGVVYHINALEHIVNRLVFWYLRSVNG